MQSFFKQGISTLHYLKVFIAQLFLGIGKAFTSLLIRAVKICAEGYDKPFFYVRL